MEDARDIVPKPRSKFLEVECKKCNEKFIIFNKSSSKLDCKCGEELTEVTGGKVIIKGKVNRVLG